MQIKPGWMKDGENNKGIGHTSYKDSNLLFVKNPRIRKTLFLLGAVLYNDAKLFWFLDPWHQFQNYRQERFLRD